MKIRFYGFIFDKELSMVYNLNYNQSHIQYYSPNSEGRKKAYESDITYGTNNEFGYKKLLNKKTRRYGFVSTGNFNESTAKVYTEEKYRCDKIK